MNLSNSELKSVAIHIFSSQLNWVIGGLLRDAADAADLTINWKLVYENKLSKLNLNKRFMHSRSNIAGVNLYSSIELFAYKKLPLSRNVSNRLLIYQIQNQKSFNNPSRIELINSMQKVVVQNQFTKSFLEKLGVNDSIIKIYPGAIDRNRFYPQLKKKEYVLISGDFKDRKNPNGIMSVIKNNLDFNFIIHGKNLTCFTEIKDLKNLKLIEWDFNKQPKLMREASVFLNLSMLEGGPISALEALASGTPIILSNTGFASEIIDGQFGSVVPINFNLDQIRNEIINWHSFSFTHTPTDFLHGKFSFEEYSKVLFK